MIPCVACVRSAIAGRSSGECFDNKSDGNRCFRCSSGHTCRALPAAAVAVCTRFVNARIAGALCGVSPISLSGAPAALLLIFGQRLNKLRTAACVALEKEGELEDNEVEALPDHKPGLKKRKDKEDDGSGDGAAFGGKASRNQMAIDAFNTLISVLKS